MGDPCESESTDVEHRDGAVRSRDESSVIGLDRRDCGNPPRGRRPTRQGRSRMNKAKPFDIPKKTVWWAFQHVKANQGAAGVDGQSIADFEIDLKNNLYKLWNRMSSGSYLPQAVRRVDIPEGDGRDATLGHTNGGGPRIAQEVVRRYSGASRLDPLCSMRTPTATDPAAQRSTPCARRVSAAGDTTGCSISTSERSSTRFRMIGSSRRCGRISPAAGCCSMWSAG